MFRKDLLSIIRSLNTIYTKIGICHASYVDWLLARPGWNYEESIMMQGPLNVKVLILSTSHLQVKVKFSRYRPGVVQRFGRGIALLFHDRGTRRKWVVSSTPRPHFTTPGKTGYTFYRRLGGPPGPVWTCGKSRPHRDSIPDRPARSQSLYQLSYWAHTSHL